MKASPTKKILCISLAIFAAYLAYKHFSVTEEDRVMAVFDTVEQGLEKKNPMKCLSVLSAHYSDSGGRNRGDVRNLLLIMARASKEIRVSFGKESLEIDGDTSKVRLAVSVQIQWGDQKSSSLAQEGSNSVQVNLRKEDGKWMVTGAEFPDSIEGWLKGLGGL